VQQHAMTMWNWNRIYDVSEHFETSLQKICVAVSLSMTVMGA
jgi:hypothetical protein